MRWTIERVSTAVGGQLIGGVETAKALRGVSIDSRQPARGQAFFAIVGQRFDGHDYWQQAVQAGAALLVLSRLPGDLPSDAPPLPVLLVDDTRRALGRLARAWRQEVDPQVVAITGSMGKTTTKELVSAILMRFGSTHRTEGNLNNDIGLPLTLLAMPSDTRFLVAEMGMNAPGEIAYLVGLADPDVGVVTNIAPVHLEGLGSLEAIARAKGELLDGLGSEAWAVVPGDEPLLAPHLARRPAERCLGFGRGAQDRVRVVAIQGRGAAGSAVELIVDGEALSFNLPLVGQHNAINAAAAIAVARALELPLCTAAEALAQTPQLSHRSSLHLLGPWQLLDDCYNASPWAMKAALDTVVDLAAGSPTAAILGEMLELGGQRVHYHREVGSYAATLPLDLLVTVGPAGEWIAEGALAAGLPPANLVKVDDPEDAAAVVAERLAGGWLLIKASRGARLERVIAALQARTKTTTGPDQGRSS